MRRTEQLHAWECEYRMSLDYVEKTDTLYVRTDTGCWKIFSRRGEDLYLLYHRNTYGRSMTPEQVIQGAYHRQGDVKQRKPL